MRIHTHILMYMCMCIYAHMHIIYTCIICVYMPYIIHHVYAYMHRIYMCAYAYIRTRICAYIRTGITLQQKMAAKNFKWVKCSPSEAECRRIGIGTLRTRFVGGIRVSRHHY